MLLRAELSTREALDCDPSVVLVDSAVAVCEEARAPGIFSPRGCYILSELKRRSFSFSFSFSFLN